MYWPQVLLSLVLLRARFPWIWYHTGVSFWNSSFWTLRAVCLFLFLFWSRSLPLSESDLTHYGCCVGVKLLVFYCDYCARYWKVPMPFHSHQASFAFTWQKLCARVKPPCLFWYLLPFKARVIFRTHSSRGQKTLLRHLKWYFFLYTTMISGGITEFLQFNKVVGCCTTLHRHLKMEGWTLFVPFFDPFYVIVVLGSDQQFLSALKTGLAKSVHLDEKSIKFDGLR